MWLSANSWAHANTPTQLPLTACQIVNPQSHHDDFKSAFHWLERLEKVLGQRDWHRLGAFFHSRLRIKTQDLQNLAAPLGFVTEGGSSRGLWSWQLFALNSLAPSEEAEIPCGDEWQVRPHFGYKTEFFAIGDYANRQLGMRLFLSAVLPSGHLTGQWRLGFLNIRLWRFAGHDYQGWLEQAQFALARNDREKARWKQAIAQDLISAIPHFTNPTASELPTLKELVQAQLSAWAKEQKDLRELLVTHVSLALDSSPSTQPVLLAIQFKTGSNLSLKICRQLEGRIRSWLPELSRVSCRIET